MELDLNFLNTINKIADAIYICDPSGHICMYNNAAIELWGRMPEPGKDLYCGSLKALDKDGQLLPTENLPMAITLKENKSLENFELVIQRPDGSLRHILQSTTPIFNVHGVLSGAVNMQIDLTDKKNGFFEKPRFNFTNENN